MQKWSWIRQGYKGKLKVSWLWCLFLLFAIYTNTTKTLCYIFLMLSVHEGMHVLAGYIFHYPVEKIIIYPFGVCAQMEYIGYGNIAKELLIVVAFVVSVFFPLAGCCFCYFISLYGILADVEHVYFYL